MYKYLIKSPGRRELKNDESIRKQKMENAGGEGQGVWKKKTKAKIAYIVDYRFQFAL